MNVEVLRPGLSTTLQDEGRPGLAHLGVGRSGAFDGPALRIANALCGNPRAACGLEVTLLGPALRCGNDATIAVTGAPLALRIDGNAASMWAPVRVSAGATVTLGYTRAGCRAYLAVRGGFTVGKVLGSRSVDVNAALGPLGGRALRAGDVLAVGAAPQLGASTDTRWSLDPNPWFRDDAPRSLRLIPGTHIERIATQSYNNLFNNTFTVHTDSNRTGLRLAGPKLAWTHPIEMVSEGCIPGLLQLPPSGQPIIFGPECPVSGGYPRLGQIAAVDLPGVAQLRPGDRLRFHRCAFAEALAALDKRERALQRLEATIARRLDPQ